MVVNVAQMGRRGLQRRFKLYCGPLAFIIITIMLSMILMLLMMMQVMTMTAMVLMKMIMMKRSKF